jgi:murein DD-endopeptidase MepM/ murein hydrolase activator NlpD
MKCRPSIIILLAILLTGCVQPVGEYEPWTLPDAASAPDAAPTALSSTYLPPTRIPGAPILTPTPDSPHALPDLRTEPDTYVVQSGDTLGTIAQAYSTDVDALMAANGITNPNLLDVGQVLTIPAPQPGDIGSAFKIIPDSELVFGPVSASLDIPGFVVDRGGYLATYSEVVEDQTLSGAAILDKVSREFSVNPRLLLAALEFQSGWVTGKNPPDDSLLYPMGWADPNRTGLYRQLAWAANALNRGFYSYGVGAYAAWVLADKTVVPINPTINAGTAGVQHLMALLYGKAGWERAVSERGMMATYQALFGYPFDLAIEPLLPSNLKQPDLALPLEPGDSWSFTGGPHGGWGDGSAWAALDFAPPGESVGCVVSDAWVVAAADGVILRAGNGAVVQDLDSDDLEQTGWTLLYMHIASEGRVAPGTSVKVGDRIGHPSCEGGVSNGTHVHFARRYNGVWISADGALPFDLEGWISSGDGVEYDGWLSRDGKTIEAWDRRLPENQIEP